MATTDDLFVELETLTNIDREEWEQILGLPEPLQKAVLANYKDQDWSKPGTETFDRILSVLGTIGTIAGVVGGVAGAAGAIKALTTS